jgi:tRNA-dihydrouridine synthase
MNIWKSLPTPFFVLAPMDDVTDWAFRSVVADCAAPDLFYTEFVNVDGLQSAGREALKKKIYTSASDKPIIAQLWGKKPENYKAVAAEMVELGFDGVDLNMGCPDKTIVKNGCCSALITDRPLAQSIIEATKEGLAGRIPLSVKTRLGFNEVDLSWHEFLLGFELDALVVHGRTRKEMSAVPADWNKIAEVVAMRDRIAPQTKIIGNGDVQSRTHGEQLARVHGVDGVMIGRGIFHDPCVFATESHWGDVSIDEKLALYARHIERFAEMQKAVGKNSDTIAPLKKFCKVYVAGFDGASDLRTDLMQESTAEGLLLVLANARSKA